MSQMETPDLPEAVLAAYRLFGLEGGEDLDTVKAAFRRRIKAVHPDSGGAEPGSVKKLQLMMKAFEVLQMYAPRELELVLTPAEARKGGLRTVQLEDKSAMVRLTPFAKSGMIFVPVGETRWRLRVLVREPIVDGGQEEGPEERARREEKARQLAELEARRQAEADAGLLKAFCEAVAKSPPGAALTRWLRKGAA
jgi:hypothetical protein